MNIWWKDEQGNLICAAAGVDMDISEIAPEICPADVPYIIADSSEELDWFNPTGYGKA